MCTGTSCESCASINMVRLYVRETAWKIDDSSTHETRTDIAAMKYESKFQADPERRETAENWRSYSGRSR